MTDIAEEDMLKVVADFAPVLHYFCKGWATFGRQSGTAVINKLLDDFNAMFTRPFKNLVLLNWNGVFLSILG